MFSTDSIAPIPVSPHANVFETGGMMCIPKERSRLRCSAVTGWSHIHVFMAGASTSGFESAWFDNGHARAMQVSRLSDKPLASFANVFADVGAISRRSAHFRNCM